MTRGIPRSILRFGVTGMLLTLAAPAFAQAPEAAPVAEGEEEVVVTGARQRAEDVRNAPIAVSTFTSKTIEDAGIDRPSDFIALTPNVSFIQTTNVGESQVHIRGITQPRDSEPPFAYVVDGVLVPNPNAFNQELVDIQQIEVIKGPIGSIYGRNAVGGAILVSTKKPSDEFEGVFKAGYEAESEEYKVGGYVSGPVANNIFGRLTVNYSDREGFFDNITRGEKEDPVSELVLRGRLVFDLSDKVELDVQAGYGKIEGNSFSFNAQLAPSARFAIVDTANTEVPFVGNLKSFNDQERYNVSAKLTVDVEPGTITAYVAHNSIEEDMGGEGAVDLAVFGAFPPGPGPFFTDPNAIVGYGPTDRDGSQYQVRNQDDTSFEVRFTSNGDQRFRYILGAYYIDFNRDVLLLTGDFGVGSTIREAPHLKLGDPGVGGTGGDSTNSAWAVFGQAAYDITDSLEISAALRYDSEDRENVNTVPGGVNAPLGFTRTATFQRAQPRISLLYKATENINFYATYGEGFRSGGFNALGSRAIIQALDDPTTSVQDNFGAETSSSYEIGVKTTFFDRRLTLNASLFSTNVENAHFFRFFPVSLARPITIVDENEIKGAEFDFQARVTDELTIFGGAGVIDTEITANAGEPTSVGKKFPFTPDHNILLGAQYTTQVMDGVDGIARIEWNQTGETWFDIRNTPGTARPVIDLVNLRLSLEGETWTASLFSRNLFDEEYNVDAVPLPIDAFGIAFNFVTRGTPRQFGAEFSYKF